MSNATLRNTTAAIVVAAVGLGFTASGASAAKNRWSQAGLAQDARAAYSHADCSGLNSELKDPVDTVWYGTQATVDTVAWALSNKLHDAAGGTWHWDDTKYPEANNPQAVYTRSLGCRFNQATRADGNPYESRHHVRIYGVDKPGTPSRRRGYITAGTGHTDHLKFGDGDCKLYGQHAATFPDGARALAEAWRGATNRRWRTVYWGNTQPIKQCDGSLAASDGYTRFLKVPAAWGKRASAASVDANMLSGPTITGNASPGQILTADAGTWSSVPASFTYQWCILPAGSTPSSSDPDPLSDCQPVGTDSPTLQLPSTSGGGLVTVRVTPVGSSSDSAYAKWVAVSNDGTATGPPVMITPPTLTGIPSGDAGFTVDPGTWQGADQILYAPMYCSTDVHEECGPSSTQPVFQTLGESSGGCRFVYSVITVIARNAAGETRVPLRSDGTYACDQ